jgi:hypothetical protein
MNQQWIGPALSELRARAGMTRQQCAVRFDNLGRPRSLSTIRVWEKTGSVKFDDVDFYVTRVLGFRMDDLYRAIEEQKRLVPNH